MKQENSTCSGKLVHGPVDPLLLNSATAWGELIFLPYNPSRASLLVTEDDNKDDDYEDRALESTDFVFVSCDVISLGGPTNSAITSAVQITGTSAENNQSLSTAQPATQPGLTMTNSRDRSADRFTLPPELSIPCHFPDCKQTFRRWNRLHRHLEIAHGQGPKPGQGVRNVWCMACGTACLDATTLLWHYARKHPGQRPEQLTRGLGAATPDTRVWWTCGVCGRRMLNTSRRRHERDGHGTERAACPVCKKEMLARSVQRHLKEQHPGISLPVEAVVAATMEAEVQNDCHDH